MNAKESLMKIVIGLIYAIITAIVLVVQFFPMYYAWRTSQTFIGFLVKAFVIEMILFGTIFSVGSLVMKIYQSRKAD